MLNWPCQVVGPDGMHRDDVSLQIDDKNMTKVCIEWLGARSVFMVKTNTLRCVVKNFIGTRSRVASALTGEFKANSTRS